MRLKPLPASDKRHYVNQTETVSSFLSTEMLESGISCQRVLRNVS